MEPLHPLQLAALLILVGCAAWWDVKSRRIPNGLTLPALVLGLLSHGLAHGMTGVGSALAGAAAGGVILGIFYLLDGMGAGDVKLMAAVGALLGWPLAVAALLGTAIAGGALALVLVIRHGIISGWSYSKRGESLLRIRLPYGVAIAAGTLWIIARGVLR
ncbi:MAG TPA: A24 family peptidase [bacterium]|nr:A24 family peptidase [bacterium]HQI48293.1 A24 family peptidase [bacterium]HQJ64909.1 A24 family peptidase [bacterium]